MNKFSYVAYFPDPFHVRDGRYAICSDSEPVQLIGANELSGVSGIVITYDAASLVDDLRRCHVLPPSGLSDIGDAIKLAVGIPKDEGGQRRANFWKWYAKHFDAAGVAREFQSTFESKSPRPESDDSEKLLVHAVRALQSLWTVVANILGATDQLERYLAIEVPVQGIFFYRQSVGIEIDRSLTLQVCTRIEGKKYRAFREVAAALNYNPTGLNFGSVQPLLDRTDVGYLCNIEERGRLHDAFKIAAFHSDFARNFLEFVTASRDDLILRQALGSGERIHAIFQIMGTVTGRILVADPYLQQLKKEYRCVIAARSGAELRYLDYCQFEPGIVAHLSGDNRLIEAYNDGDLYTALSRHVFGSEDRRPISKQIFLAFCYGMSIDGISRLLVGPTSSQNIAYYRDAINSFFSAFDGLERLRAESTKSLSENGFVSSLSGNRRYRSRSGELDASERRWALNQRVQSTASLIFKEALVAIVQKLGRDSVLLPVHDAVLLQINSDKHLVTNVNTAVEEMKVAFRRYCPDIVPRVSVEEFAR